MEGGKGRAGGAFSGLKLQWPPLPMCLKPRVQSGFFSHWPIHAAVLAGAESVLAGRLRRSGVGLLGSLTKAGGAFSGLKLQWPPLPMCLKPRVQSGVFSH